jgi:IS5 family transposase
LWIYLSLSQTFCQLGERVINQTRRRVLQGETVPAEEKLYSIFEPHTDLIKRGKTLKPVEFVHKVFRAESAHGLITEYRVLDGNPVDSDHVQASLDQHQKTFQHPPDRYAADRGFHSDENVQKCKDAGVSQVCIPQRGGQKTAEQEELERSRDFKRGQRFRGGNRRAYLGAVSRPGHETLSAQRLRAIRDSGGRCGTGE